MKRWIIRHECAHLAVCALLDVPVHSVYFGKHGGMVTPEHSNLAAFAAAAVAPLCVGLPPSQADYAAVANLGIDSSQRYAAVLWLRTNKDTVRARTNALARALRPYARNGTLILNPLSSVGTLPDNVRDWR